MDYRYFRFIFYLLMSYIFPNASIEISSSMVCCNSFNYNKYCRGLFHVNSFFNNCFTHWRAYWHNTSWRSTVEPWLKSQLY